MAEHQLLPVIQTGNLVSWTSPKTVHFQLLLYKDKMSYAGLHVHTHYSLFDGIATPQEYVDRAVEIGMPAIAITDHGSLSGHREMYRVAIEKGIKPILGIEGYIAQDRFDQRDKAEREETPLDLVYNHLIILAKNEKGLENLNKLNEIAWTEGYYKKPRIDFEVLSKYKVVKICTKIKKLTICQFFIEIQVYLSQGPILLSEVFDYTHIVHLKRKH